MSEIKLVCADSVDYMKRHMMSGSVGLIIADPLYDLNSVTRSTIHAQLLRICDGTIIVFCPPENQWQPTADEYLFWEKPISTKNTSKRYSRFVEMMLVYHGAQSKWNTGRNWSQYPNVFKDLVDTDLQGKGWRKPPSLITRLILNHVDRTRLVFDPFMGSGVVAECCIQQGLDYIGIEEDQNEFDQTVQRVIGLSTRYYDVHVEIEADEYK